MIHQAKIKSEEEIPPSFFCCAVQTEKLRRQAGKIIFVDPSDVMEATAACHSCGQPFGATRWIKQIADEQKWISAELIHIDELPCTAPFTICPNLICLALRRVVLFDPCFPQPSFYA